MEIVGEKVEHRRTALRLLSYLLRYPDAEMIRELAGARPEALEQEEQCTVADLIDHLLESPLLDLQEQYTALFDLNPECCLNLTYHRWGDEKERGAALARFAQHYLDAGYAPVTGELPDFLPLVLEFLSVGDDTACARIREEYAGIVTLLEKRLSKAGTPYAAVFSILGRMFDPRAGHLGGTNG